MTADDFIWTTSSHSSNGGAECVEVGWHKSSYSPDRNGDCVEAGLQQVPTLRYALRDSKNRAAGHFTLPAHEWAAFLHAVRAHHYDGPATD